MPLVWAQNRGVLIHFLRKAILGGFGEDLRSDEVSDQIRFLWVPLE